MAPAGPMEASVEEEAGYGMRSFSDRLTATPHVVVADSAWGRQLTFGYRLSREPEQGDKRRFELDVAGTEHQPVDGTPRRRAATLAMSVLW